MSAHDSDAAWARPIAIAVAGAALMFTLGIRKEARAHRPAPLAPVAAPAAPKNMQALRVPHASALLKMDGDLDEADWTRAPARTGAFVSADGSPARPFSEARVLWDEKNLYLALYAADEDIRVAKAAADGALWTGDAFSMTVTRADGSVRTIDVGPSGNVTDGSAAAGTAPVDYTWQSGAVIGTDVDGTPDDPRDRDEEWIVEMSVPLATLGISGRRGERIGFEVKRCDTVLGKRHCGAWGKGASPGVLVLE